MASRCDIGTLVRKDHINKLAVISIFATKLPVGYDLGTIIPSSRGLLQALHIIVKVR